MKSVFEVGDIVSVTSVAQSDELAGIKIGSEGLVHSEYSGGGCYVKFEGISRGDDGSYWKGGARLMGDSQLTLVRRLVAKNVEPEVSTTDHLSVVSAATLDYQRLLREYAAAEKAKDAAYEALSAAEKVQRDTGVALNKASIALNKAHYDAAGVTFPA